jgi:hypothetical protein
MLDIRTPSAVMRGGNARRASARDGRISSVDARGTLWRATSTMHATMTTTTTPRTTTTNATRVYRCARRPSRAAAAAAAAAAARVVAARASTSTSMVAFASTIPRDGALGAMCDGATRARDQPRLHGRRRRRASSSFVARAGRDDERDPRLISRLDKAKNRENAQTWLIVGSIALLMTTVVAVVYENASDGFLYGVDSIESYADGGGDFEFSGEESALSLSTVAGGALWAVALYFASPVSVLLLFLGRTDSERPSDWVLKKATGVAKMEDASTAAQAAVVAWFAICGVAIAVLGESAFGGDSTWGISAGVGFLTIAGVSELGRPKRIDAATLSKLEAQYDDFCIFASTRLSRSAGGRVHQTEISKAFRSAYPAYTEDVLDEMELRSLIANFAPSSERSPRGYYKNLSLIPINRSSVKDLGL